MIMPLSFQWFCANSWITLAIGISFDLDSVRRSVSGKSFLKMTSKILGNVLIFFNKLQNVRLFLNWDLQLARAFQQY